MGEIIVFSTKKETAAFKSIMREQKIYAICSEREETVKILDKIGVVSQKSISLSRSNAKENRSSVVMGNGQVREEYSSVVKMKD